MKKTSTLILALIVAISLILGGCARQPSPKTSASLIKKYFHKYGKKYKDSVYGKSQVKEVDVRSIEEVHKNLIATEAFLTLDDGNVIRIHATVERGPFGWRFVSWENATGM